MTAANMTMKDAMSLECFITTVRAWMTFRRIDTDKIVASLESRAHQEKLQRLAAIGAHLQNNVKRSCRKIKQN